MRGSRSPIRCTDDRMTVSGRLALLAACLVAGGIAAGARAADVYPSRPIRIVIPTAPGGAGDVLARYLGERLSAALRVPVVHDNRPGAGGLIGTESVARAPADGYTLLFATAPTHIIAPLTARASFDPLRDFSPVFNAALSTSVIVVSAKLPVTTLDDFIRYAKERPGALNYASSGVGSANHLDTEVFAQVAGLSLVHVPYRGTADGYRALVADEVQVMFGAVTSALPAINAGTVRPLVVLTDHRSPVLPDVPTLAEAGLFNVDVRKWLGFVAPAATPPAVVARLNAAFDGIVREPAVRDWMARQGLEPVGGSAQSFGRYLVQDEAKWQGIVSRMGLRAPAGAH